MRQPSVQFSTVASLMLHVVVFGMFLYTVQHQPRFVMPKAYSVKLVSTVKSPVAEPSLGQPHTVAKPVEKVEPPAPHVESSKSPKYEMKEATKPEPKHESPKPVDTAKHAPLPPPVKPPVKPVEEKGTKIVKEAPKVVKETHEPVAAKPETTKKPTPKDTPKDTAKDATGVEDRIAMLKSKKKLEQHAMLRSVVDLGKKDVKMGQSPTGMTQSSSPSFGDAVNNEYSDIVGAHVRKRWAYPESGKKSLEAIVVFTIRQDGRIEGMKLEKSSGNSFFDRTALSAVNKSVPMPQPPLDTYEVGIRFIQ